MKHPAHFIHILLGLSVCTAAVLCSGGCSTSVGDASDGRHILDDDGIAITLPDGDWEIAEQGNLPAGVSFCAAIPAEGICTLLIADSIDPDTSDAWQLPEQYIRRRIAAITSQNLPSDSVSYSEAVIGYCRYGADSIPAINFQTQIEIGSTGVDYTGYILTNRGKSYCMVTLTPPSITADNRRVAREATESLKFSR